MENSVNMFGKSESPTRLQRQAPPALYLDRVPDNTFLHQSCDGAVAAAAIPLLSPLLVSASPHSSPSRDEHEFMFPVSSTEKNGSQSSMDHKEGWQYSAKADDSNQKALLNISQTKFVLVDQSQ